MQIRVKFDPRCSPLQATATLHLEGYETALVVWSATAATEDGFVNVHITDGAKWPENVSYLILGIREDGGILVEIDHSE